MKTITRRAALAVSITLPLLPVSAFATPAGLAGQLRMGLGMFADPLWEGDDFDNPSDYLFEGCRDDMDGRLYRNMLAGAEGRANASEPVNGHTMSPRQIGGAIPCLGKILKCYMKDSG